MDFVYRRNYRGKLKAVILDWAGTTMDYGCYAPAVVFVEVYKRKGVPISMEEARVPMGAHKKVHIRKISQIDSVSERWKEMHGRKPNENDVDEMFADFVPLQLACLADYTDLIPGTIEAITHFRKRGLKIGSTTGYLPEMMTMLKEEASQRGYVPDSSVCAGDVPAGRPEPWMCLENAKNLGVYPMESIVKVDDTLPGIDEGLNAGMWSIGLAKTGNEIGLNQEEIEALPPDELQAKLEGAYQRMWQVGAHYVVDGIWDVPPVLDLINERLSRGERP
ncbi:TPA: phosphonoacetaldehyde hydrolase [Candidatus Poribacteria bacterium]|jgi:phosphonoacetaldehyde hydrolase|nr:phosphonoacetaldehyde hydrolase [Candidatus Poribacteria bacterium]HIB88612.1 phosphonoacetaldehyde hydrolase [Candidatus Poribacteria bacterium]HIC01236.1 phosphonoacetaldehyde hydrolase [Candidatus Poribacteria bacterium]HIC17485.1 phosphonoacetaldehyde hydrolase [Candidatus Poribacteria bacterium]HIN29164.1 phosphonoacetaldehyde hydrolase [Candidatus Poribacteria bacterium]